MARSRNIKPGFFMNEILAEIEPLGRLLFAGLWTIADRAGRLEDRPKKIKAEVLPYDDCDIEKLLNDLHSYGFIFRYQVNGVRYIQIINFKKHQNPHKNEAPSSIPEPNEHSTSTVQISEVHNTNPADSLNLDPDSLNPIDTVGLTPDHAPQPEKIPYAEIIDYLNQVCGTDFKHSTKSSRDHIKARWNEGFRVGDFKTVISKKARDWLTDPEHVQYLRPITLFGTKFESYLNQREAEKGGGKPREPTAADRRNTGASDRVNWDKFYAPGAGPPKM